MPVIFQVVLRGARPSQPSGNPGRRMPDQLWALVERCWSQQFSDRLSMPEVVESMEASGFGH